MCTVPPTQPVVEAEDMVKQPDLGDLIRAAQRAEPGAVDRLLPAYRNYLQLFARIWLSKSIAAKVDPSDLVQESLLRAADRFGQFRGTSETELAVWLRQILARLLADAVRHYHTAAREVEREQSLEDLLEGSGDALDQLIAASGSSPSRLAQRRELGVLLADALADMPHEHREVIILRNLQELDWPEVAHRMGRSVAAVRMLWARALKELRPKIEDRL